MMPTTLNDLSSTAKAAGCANMDSLIPACVSEVLETMFFCDCEPAAEDEPPAEGEPPADARFHAVVRFDGSPSGRFWLSISRDAAFGLAADFLGLDREEVDDERARQTVCELTNMICGSVVSRVEAESAFQLEAPQILETADAARPRAFRFTLEAGLLEVACGVD